MATQIHGAGPAGQRSPGLDLAIAGYLNDNPPAGGGASTLGDLTDVDTTGATTGQVLTFDGSEWSPDAPSAGTVTSTSISDSTATGRAVLTAADAATARTAIGAGTSSFDGTYGSLSGAPSLATVATTGDYDDLSGKPTLGTAAAEDVEAFATAAQGAKADAALPSGLVDAKGDLIVGTADNTVTRLPAGTNGHVLTADSGETAGVKWAEPSGGGSTDQDTGWRNIISTVDDTRWNTTASGANYARIRRVGIWVYVSIRLARTQVGENRAQAEAGTIAPVPLGFRGYGLGPKGQAQIIVSGVLHMASSGSANNLQVTPNGAGGTWGAGDLAVIEGIFPTNEAWPSTLPGVPV